MTDTLTGDHVCVPPGRVFEFVLRTVQDCAQSMTYTPKATGRSPLGSAGFAQMVRVLIEALIPDMS